MTGRTHDLAAFTALGFIALTHPLPQMTLATGMTAIVANLMGGIAPDIDQPTAPFWRNLPIGHYFGRFFDRILGGHRFLSHSLIGVAIFGYGFKYILQILTPSFPKLNMEIIWWAFMIGFLSHLAMDMFTREGVPWLLPVPIKFGIPPFQAFRISTGKFIERFIVFPGLVIFNIIMYYVNYQLLLDILHKHLK